MDFRLVFGLLKSNFQSRAEENPNYKTDQFYNIDSDLEVNSNIEETEENNEPRRWGCSFCFNQCTR